MKKSNRKNEAHRSRNFLQGFGSVVEIAPSQAGAYGWILRSAEDRYDAVRTRIASSLFNAVEAIVDEQKEGKESQINPAVIEYAERKRSEREQYAD